MNDKSRTSDEKLKAYQQRLRTMSEKEFQARVAGFETAIKEASKKHRIKK